MNIMTTDKEKNVKILATRIRKLLKNGVGPSEVWWDDVYTLLDLILEKEDECLGLIEMISGSKK